MTAINHGVLPFPPPSEGLLYARALEKLLTGSVSGAPVADIPLHVASHRNKCLHFTARPATDGASLLARVSTDGGATFDSGGTNYSNAVMGIDSAGAVQSQGNASSQLNITSTAGAGVGNLTTEGIYGAIQIYDPANGVTWSRFTWEAAFVEDSGSVNLVHVRGAGLRRSPAKVDWFRFLFSSGNIASLDWTLYGWR